MIKDYSEITSTLSRLCTDLNNALNDNDYVKVRLLSNQVGSGMADIWHWSIVAEQEGNHAKQFRMGT